MDIKFYSYFNSQKKLLNSKIVFAINPQKNKTVLINENAYIFIYFLTIEKLIINSQGNSNSTSNFLDKKSLYSLFFTWNTVNIKNSQKAVTATVDNFVSFYSSFLTFTSIFNNINVIAPIVFYFDNYNIFYKTNSLTDVIITKNERFQYQQIVDIFTQNNFFQDFNSGSAMMFNKIYFENKNFKIKNKNKTFKRLCSKQFINLLSERHFVSKVIKQSNPFKYNLFSYKTILAQNKFIIPFYKSYWNNSNISKKSKVAKKVIYNNSSFSKTYNKAIEENSFIFQNYPTNFQENIVNSSVFNQIKNILSLVTNSRFSFYQINALSLARYAFDLEAKNKNIELDQPDQLAPTFLFKSKKSYFFLSQLEQKLESRYRYVAVHIKDIIRVSFFSRYLKKANFLATFYAFVLSKLPRKRKETKLISFMITLLKIFSAERKEILGIRIRFQGRLNRWRRTKHIVGKKGILYDYSHNNYRDFGIGQAITRKGTQGIRIWLCYKADFASHIQKSIRNYRTLAHPIKIINL